MIPTPKKKPNLSVTAVENILTCPRLYFYRNVERREPEVPPLPLKLGSTMDETLGHYATSGDVDECTTLLRKRLTELRLIYSGVQQELEEFEVQADYMEALFLGWVQQKSKSKKLMRSGKDVRVQARAQKGNLRGFADIIVGDTIIDHKLFSMMGEDMMTHLQHSIQPHTYMYLFDSSSFIFNILRKPLLRRKQSEDLAQFQTRVREDIEDRPTFYFAEVEVKQSDAVLEDVKRLYTYAEQVIALSKENGFPKNYNSCMKWNRLCEFYNTCTE